MNYSKKAHAEHNERTCSYLNTEGKFPDWVVTTAFYAALHYVQHEIFPLQLPGRTFANFDAYYNSLGTNKSNKHSETIELVFQEFGEDVGILYKWLHDHCWTARYNNFNVTTEIAKNSIDNLNELKTYLSK